MNNQQNPRFGRQVPDTLFGMIAEVALGDREKPLPGIAVIMDDFSRAA